MVTRYCSGSPPLCSIKGTVMILYIPVTLIFSALAMIPVCMVTRFCSGSPPLCSIKGTVMILFIPVTLVTSLLAMIPECVCLLGSVVAHYHCALLKVL